MGATPCDAKLIRIGHSSNGTDDYSDKREPCTNPAEVEVTSLKSGKMGNACQRHVGMVARELDPPPPKPEKAASKEPSPT